MSSQKLFVVLVLVLITICALSAGDVLAQGGGNEKSDQSTQSKATATPPQVLGTRTSASSSVATTGTAQPDQPHQTGSRMTLDSQTGTLIISDQNGVRMIQSGGQQRPGRTTADPYMQRRMVWGSGGGGGGGGGGFYRTSAVERSSPIDPETAAIDEQERNLEQAVNKIVEDYNSTTDQEEQASLKKKLEKVTGEMFNIRQQRRELEVKRLENELARIRESIQKRNENREQIIKRRVAQLLHKEGDLEF